jgi:xanthine dehydrogenase YagS FAD-binding subunit
VRRFEWVSATSLPQALAQAGAGAAIKAGGIDLLDRLKEGLEAPARVVNLREVEGLRAIREEREGLSIGALATLSAVAVSAPVRARFPALAAAAARAATPHVRNVATAGGNLLQRPRCWYFRRAAFHCLRKGGQACFAQDGENQYHAVFGNGRCAMVHPSDLATALVALDARAQIASPAGARLVPVAELFVAPEEEVQREHLVAQGEILTGVYVPWPSASVRTVYLKQRERESADWPLASVAASVSVRDGAFASALLVLGAAAPVPWRARAAEAALLGQPVGEAAVAAALDAELARATPLARNGYKVALFQALGQRAILQAAGA